MNNDERLNPWSVAFALFNIGILFLLVMALTESIVWGTFLVGILLTAAIVGVCLIIMVLRGKQEHRKP